MPNTPTEVQELGDELLHFHYTGDPGTAAYVILGIAPRDCFCEHVVEQHTVANGATLTAVVAKVDSGDDPTSASNQDAVSGSIDLNATANTWQSAKGLSTTANEVSRGDLIVLKFSEAAQSTLGVVTVNVQFTTRRK